MTIVNVPRGLMRWTYADWDIDWRNQSTGSGNDGNDQTVFTRFPRWVGSPELHYSRANVQIWRAVRSAARGRANIYRLPLVDSFVPMLATAKVGINFSNAKKFSTGKGFKFVPRVVCPDGAAAGASEITITDSALMPVRVGQFISHNDWPMIVRSITPDGSGVRLEVEMPLRRSIPAGDEIDLYAHGFFRVLNDNTGNPGYSASKTSDVRLDVAEWLNRP